MKKPLSVGLIVATLTLSFMACSPKPSVPKAGAARAMDMLTLIPKTAAGLIVIDVHGAMNTEAAKKAIAENESYQKYQEFIKETGLDPQNDVYFVAVALGGNLTEAAAVEGSAIVNLRYSRDLLLAKMKEKSAELTESEYNGLKVYRFTDPSSQKPTAAVFLDDSNLVAGSEGGVEAVIDVFQKKSESVLANKELMALIDQSNTAALVWSAFLIPSEATAKMGENPFLSSLKGIKSLVFSFDYKNQSLMAEIAASGMDESANKQVAEMLTGLKSLGAAGAAKEPKVGELLNKIEITATATQVRISASIPEGLLQELSKKINLQKAIGEKKEELH